MIDLGTLGGTCGFPSWINSNGQVVGNSDVAGDVNQHAFVWTRSKGMQDLGTLGGSDSETSMINDSGLIVGGAFLPGDNQYDAVLWDGKMHDLGTLNGSNCTYAFSVNAKEQVVGNDCGGTFAFLWEDGGPMVDLSTLVTSNPGLSDLGVITINDAGEIAGIGIDASGYVHTVLLIPCDGNHPNIDGCDYSLVDPATAAEAHPALTKGTASRVKFSPAEMMARFRSTQVGRNRRFGTPQTSPQ
jgi:probable HAF family extracellular repeat protein